MLKPNPQRDGMWRWGFRRCWDCEGGALVDGIRALIERDHRELPCPVCHLRTQPEDGRLRTRKWVPTRQQMCWRLNLGLANLWNCEKWISVVHKPPSLWSFVTAVQTDLDSTPYILKTSWSYCFYPSNDRIISPDQNPGMSIMRKRNKFWFEKNKTVHQMAKWLGWSWVTNIILIFRILPGRWVSWPSRTHALADFVLIERRGVTNSAEGLRPLCVRVRILEEMTFMDACVPEMF